MPESSSGSRRVLAAPLEEKRDRRAAGVPYVELHCKSNFSFLEGASHPDELVARAAELGYHGLALTDRASLAGIVRAHTAAKQADVNLLIGAEIALDEGGLVVLLATDRLAYGRLCRLLTVGRQRAPKGECLLTLDDLAEFGEGLIALAGMPIPCRWEKQLDDLHQLRTLFGDRCYALVERFLGRDDRSQLAERVRLARRARVPIVAANDVHYHVRGRRILQDALVAIRHNTSIAGAERHLFPNSERYLKSSLAMARLFADHPDALTRTLEVASRCRFRLDELRYEYPRELAPDGETPMEYLRRLTDEGVRQRYPSGVPAKVVELLEHELELIADLQYEPYFLTVWDLVSFARSRGILCQGRGSAANSVVCFCLGITSVDPERIDVLFERFVSRERNEAPDIDIDFEHERREEVLQYLYAKYGRERCGMTAEVVCYRTRSAIRDLGKALGVSPERIDALAKNVESVRDQATMAGRFQEAGVDPSSPLGKRLFRLVPRLVSFPRHLSQHVGGMVMTEGPLCEVVPIENAAMAERTVIQWNKDDLDDVGILKVDCLSLGMLTAIRKCFALIAADPTIPADQAPPGLTLATVPPEDPRVYDMICRADTMGVFQIESRAQMSMLPRLKPRCFYDLVIEVAIVRPGPIQGDMVHPYLRRRAGEEAVEFPSEAVRSVLEKTMGVPIFQEQAMRLAIVAAGFTPGEADQLRRAMGAWRKTGLIEQFRQRLIEGMLRNGLTQEFAERVFHQIRGFGEYGFPESHAASFALLVYVSAWLKCHHLSAFTAAILNSLPMGFYAPAQLVRNAREQGVCVLPVDVNASEWSCTLEVPPDSASRRTQDKRRPQPALRLGLRQINGLNHRVGERIVAVRAEKPYRSMEDFGRRTGLSGAVLEQLARADAFSSLRLDRRHALWDALAVEKKQAMPLFASEEEEAWGDLDGSMALSTADSNESSGIPPLTEGEQILEDYRTMGLSLRRHPVALIRSKLAELGVVAAAELRTLPPDRWVRVAGVVIMRQQPQTARGIRFVTLEDESGITNLIVRPEVWERQRAAARHAILLLAHGRLQRHAGVIHVVSERLDNVSALMGELKTKSRDFR